MGTTAGMYLLAYSHSFLVLSEIYRVYFSCMVHFEPSITNQSLCPTLSTLSLGHMVDVQRPFFFQTLLCAGLFKDVLRRLSLAVPRQGGGVTLCRSHIHLPHFLCIHTRCSTCRYTLELFCSWLH